MKIYTYTKTDDKPCYGVGFQAETAAQIDVLKVIAKRLQIAAPQVSAHTAILHIDSEEILTGFLRQVEEDDLPNRLINQAYVALHTRQSDATDLVDFGLLSPDSPSETSSADSQAVPSPQTARRSPVQRPSPVRVTVGSHADPARRSSITPSSPEQDKITFENALKQTTAARACLYWPSDVLTQELKTAAIQISRFVRELPPPLIIGLCARLFGPEGLNPDPTFIERTANQSNLYGNGHSLPSTEQNELAEYCKNILLHKILAPVVSAKKESLLGHQRAMTIALMGDIGALMAATGATTGTERPAWVSKRLQEAFAAFALNLEGKTLSLETAGLVLTSVERCKALGGGEVVGPTKKAERTRIEENHLPRTGIHDTGLLADTSLGLLGKIGTIPKSTWATARVHIDRIPDDVTEPFAGHMSASPSEILWAWDVLAGRGLEHAYSGSVPKETVVSVTLEIAEKAEKKVHDKMKELEKATEVAHAEAIKGWGPKDDNTRPGTADPGKELERAEEMRKAACRELKSAQIELAQATAAVDAARKAIVKRVTDATEARSAGACALLVGCGYHSAVEVAHGTMVYHGQVPNKITLAEAGKSRGGVKDIASVLYAGSATHLVDELLMGATSEDALTKRSGSPVAAAKM